MAVKAPVKLLIAAVTLPALVAVVANVPLRLVRAALTLLMAVCVFRLMFKLTLALIFPSCLLILETIAVTFLGPRRLSCAVRLKACAISSSYIISQP